MEKKLFYCDRCKKEIKKYKSIGDYYVKEYPVFFEATRWDDVKGKKIVRLDASETLLWSEENKRLHNVSDAGIHLCWPCINSFADWWKDI